MSNIGKEIKDSYVSHDYSPTEGCFKAPRLRGEEKKYWGTCRDGFHYDFNIDEHDHFYWCANNYRKQAQFIDLVEDLFNIKSEYRTRINPVSNPDGGPIVKIIPSPFWLTEQMRICFFTIILKATLDEHGPVSRTNLIKCLKGCDYSQDTERAIALFLSGRTTFTSKTSFYNWCDHFRHEDERTGLIFPKSRRFHRRKRVDTRLTAREKASLAKWVRTGEEYRYNSEFKSFTFDRSC